MNTMTASPGLNPEQEEAVCHRHGPCLVLAGAGSGKTRVVTSRIADLLHSGVPDNQILAVTFTNKAAGEMKERVRQATHSQVLICTFHSLGARILRRSIPSLGYSSDFVIYDEDDCLKVLKSCMSALNLKEAKGQARSLKAMISGAKNRLESPRQIDRSKLKTDLEIAFPEVYAMYQNRMKEFNALDFDDLLYLTVRLFQEDPVARDFYQSRWSYVLVDEYQDTNQAQYLLSRTLVEKTGNLFVVGDPDQSIYSWRGADITNILNFEKDFSGAKIVRLEQNYRSTETILNAANELIKNNNDRYEKNLWSANGAGDKINLYSGNTELDEAEYVIQRIKKLTRSGDHPLKEIVVFYRTNAQSRVFEDLFLREDIPYTIVGGISFYQRREIKDILALLRVVSSDTDFVSLARTINLPKRGIGATTLENLSNESERLSMPIFELCKKLAMGSAEGISVRLSSRQKAGLKDYVQCIMSLRALAKKEGLGCLIEDAIKESRYLDYLRTDPESFDERKENLDALIAKGHDTEEDMTLNAFLEELSLKSTLDETQANEDRLCLMTLHNGKGLEFDTVFLVGAEEDLLPHSNSRKEPSGVEEERRLFYVGMTRARKRLHISFARSRFLWGGRQLMRPSRFLNEFSHDYVEQSGLSRAPTKTIERAAPSDGVEGRFVKGNRVCHPSFGEGIITDSYVGSMGRTYKIRFDQDSKEKTLVAKYAKLTQA